MTVSFQIPELETERLRLRLPKASDLPAVEAFRTSRRSVGVGGPYEAGTSFHYMSAVIGQWQLRGYGRWIVADKETDAALGLVGIYHPEDWPEPEIGWSIYAENAEGRGIAHEAALAARDYAYTSLGWDRIVSLVMPDNVRSIALAERMGCQKTSRFNHPTYGALDIWVHAPPGGAVMTLRHELPTPGPAAALAAKFAALVPTIKSKRFVLRDLKLSDFPACADIACSARGKFVGGPMSREDAWYEFTSMCAGWMLHGHGGFAIEDPASADVLGFVVLGLEPGDNEVELGYALTEAATGKGVASETALAVRDWAARDLNLTGLVSYIDPDNVASVAVATRLKAVRDPDAEACFDHPVHVYRHPKNGEPN